MTNNGDQRRYEKRARETRELAEIAKLIYIANPALAAEPGVVLRSLPTL